MPPISCPLKSYTDLWTALTKFQKECPSGFVVFIILGMPCVRRPKIARHRSLLLVLLQTLFLCFARVFTSFAEDHGPQSSLKLMEVADGFEVSLVASEP